MHVNLDRLSSLAEKAQQDEGRGQLHARVNAAAAAGAGLPRAIQGFAGRRLLAAASPEVPGTTRRRASAAVKLGASSCSSWGRAAQASCLLSAPSAGGRKRGSWAACAAARHAAASS